MAELCFADPHHSRFCLPVERPQRRRRSSPFSRKSHQGSDREAERPRPEATPLGVRPMIETLMAQLYYPDLRRRVEDLEARHQAGLPKQIYLIWYDTDDHNDPIMVIGTWRRRMVARRPSPPARIRPPPRRHPARQLKLTESTEKGQSRRAKKRSREAETCPSRSTLCLGSPSIRRSWWRRRGGSRWSSGGCRRQGRSGSGSCRRSRL